MLLCLRGRKCGIVSYLYLIVSVILEFYFTSSGMAHVQRETRTLSRLRRATGLVRNPSKSNLKTPQ